MSEAPIEQVPVTPKVRKPRKATIKAKGGVKAAAKVKAAPAKVKAASKAPKAKAKAAKAGVPRDEYGFSLNSLKSKAAAMYGSKKGATLNEVREKLNSTQLNVLTYLESKGYKVSKVKEDGDGKREVTRYFLRAK